jgi:hypothetical protein
LFLDRPNEQIPVTGIDCPSGATNQALDGAELFMLNQIKAERLENGKV